MLIRTLALLLALALALACSACLGGGPSSTPPRPSGPVPLQISSDPPGVELFLDGRYMGELERWRGGVLPVPPGQHRLELVRKGYFPLKRMIEVGPEGKSLKARLRRDPMWGLR